jgi:hypothetical protein
MKVGYPPTYGVGDIVELKAQVLLYYDDGYGWWLLEVNLPGTYLKILQEGP